MPSPTIVDVAQAMREVLEPALDIQQAFDEAPESDDAYPLIRWYADPGGFTPAQHLDRFKRPVWNGTHGIVWVWVNQFDDEATAQIAGLEALWAMFGAIAAGMSRNQLGGTVAQMGEMTVQEFGWSPDNDDKRFMVALRVQFAQDLAIDGGRRDG